jgi:hypothetical protein
MNTNDLFNAVMQLDLEPIKTKLMHVESGEGWSLEKANAVEKEYRRFLCLMKMYPDEDTAPLVDVDTFWHYHILDTMKYAADCEQAFGYFLHHYPYVGMRGEDDEQFRLDSGNRMRELYEATFGDAYPGSEAVAERAGFDGIEGIRIPGAAVRAAAYCAGPRAETAYCAGPRAETAYCAGPRAETAYCAGPRVKAQAARGEGAEAATAYCAGPRAKTAYCAGPRAEMAYCAGPRVKAQAARGEGAVAATAYCAGPRAETAYCAGPRVKTQAARGESAMAATAYCAGPRAETAYCAGPRVEAQAGPSIGARDIASASLPA